MQGPFFRSVYHLLRLVAELRGHLLMRGQHLGCGKRLLAVAGGVGGNLCSLRSLEPGLFHLLFNLLRPRAGRIKVRLRVALDFRCATLPRLKLINQLAEMDRESRLIQGSRVILLNEH